MTPDRATLFAVVFLSALVGHEGGDYGLQTDKDACGKAPDAYNITKGIPYWQTWKHNLRHVGTYHLALAGTVLVTTRAVGLRLNWRRAALGLAVSAVSHSIIDRRWPVKLLMEHTGSAEWYDDGKELVDQMLHKVFLLAASLIACSGTVDNQP